jgi:hypothetical protein
MVVAESMKFQVLYLATGEGNVPFCDDKS